MSEFTKCTCRLSLPYLIRHYPERAHCFSRRFFRSLVSYRLVFDPQTPYHLACSPYYYHLVPVILFFLVFFRLQNDVMLSLNIIMDHVHTLYIFLNIPLAFRVLFCRSAASSFSFISFRRLFEPLGRPRLPGFGR